MGRSAAHEHDRLQPACRGGNRLQRSARRLQGARKGLLPMASPAASSSGGANRNSGRPLSRRLPASKGSRHLHRGSNDGERERGVRASFGKRMILPL
ncbi:hypothetical protein BHE74_00015545 [Ensete ventricosum]|nr:hypothetical protein GW17_00019714 [Ensete ventricosum]RWW76361.1 hypothetical protein BHE74_00015545 [Ensete ventricosum]